MDTHYTTHCTAHSTAHYTAHSTAHYTTHYTAHYTAHSTAHYSEHHSHHDKVVVHTDDLYLLCRDWHLVSGEAKPSLTVGWDIALLDNTSLVALSLQIFLFKFFSLQFFNINAGMWSLWHLITNIKAHSEHTCGIRTKF